MNSMTARYEDLDPVSVHVPMTGGPDNDVMVPIFSRAVPVRLGAYETSVLYKKFKGIPEDCNLEKTLVPFAVCQNPTSESYNLCRLITAVGLGMCGDDNAIASAYVRTNLMPSVK